MLGPIAGVFRQAAIEELCSRLAPRRTKSLTVATKNLAATGLSRCPAVSHEPRGTNKWLYLHNLQFILTYIFQLF